MKRPFGHIVKAALAVAVLAPALAACGGGPGGGKAVRVAYFPNITHVQPLVGLARGTFQEAMGDVRVHIRQFNAGPSEIEALFAGEVDIGYIGQSPAVNGFIRSRGEALRVIAGAVSGGASLVVRADSGIGGPRDLAGKRIASPQLGNTQDISLRHWLQTHGLKARERGGSVEVIPIRNPDILALFLRKEIDGAWVPEPWATRLLVEGGGKLLVDERELWPQGRFATTIVIARKKYLDQHPEAVRRWLRAHVEVTRWVTEHPQEAQEILRRELERLTGTALPASVAGAALGRMEVLHDPLREAIGAAGLRAYELGYLGPARPNLERLVDLGPLNGVLRELGLQEVRQEAP